MLKAWRRVWMRPAAGRALDRAHRGIRFFSRGSQTGMSSEIAGVEEGFIDIVWVALPRSPQNIFCFFNGGCSLEPGACCRMWKPDRQKFRAVRTGFVLNFRIVAAYGLWPFLSWLQNTFALCCSCAARTMAFGLCLPHCPAVMMKTSYQSELRQGVANRYCQPYFFLHGQAFKC